MADRIRFRRGNFSDLPALGAGEPGLALDTKKVYIGHADGNLQFQMAAGTSDYIIYVASSTYGGKSQATQGATGLRLASGTATGSSPNKLIDSNASFTAALVDMAVYNAADDTWARVTAVDSTTQLSLSANIFASGEAYEIASAIDNLPEAFGSADSGFRANITIRVSPGTFSDDVTFIGKTAGDNKTLTVKGSTTGSTTISGRCIFRQRLTLENLTFTNKLYSYFGADLSWYACATSGVSRLYMYAGATNYFEGSAITFGNDPGNYISASSLVTKGYTMYIASTALGGDDAVADGLAMYSGSATSTAANKLVDSGANFGTDVVGKPVYNSTDDTWAKIIARDSATQLSLSADIMANGEAYTIPNAYSTLQAAVDAIPGSVNCGVTLKLSGGTFAGATIQGKVYSGSFGITVKGTHSIIARGISSGSNTNDFPFTQSRFTDSSKSLTLNAHVGKTLKITGGAGVGQQRVVLANGTNYWDIVGLWDTLPDNTSTYKVVDCATVISDSPVCIKVVAGQQNVTIQDLKFTTATSQAVYIETSKCDVLGCVMDLPCLNAVMWTAGAVGNGKYNYICRPAGGLQYGLTSQGGATNFFHNYIQASLAPMSFTGGAAIIENPGVRGNYLTGGGQGQIFIFGLSHINNIDYNHMNGGAYGMQLWHGSAARIAMNNIIENASSHGIYAWTGMVQFTSPNNNRIRNNGGWGVRGVNTSVGVNMTLPAYSGNASGTWSFDASTFSTGS